jgi:signal transduction histidine kinase
VKGTRRLVNRRSGETYAAADLVSPVVAWDAEELAAAGVSATVWRALRQAATITCDEWDNEREGGTRPEDVRAALGLLCDLVRRYAESADARLLTFPTSVPSNRLLDSLRRAFVAQVRASGDAFDLPQVLCVLESIDRVSVAIDHDSAQRFVSRLSGPDATQLLVEVAHDMRSPLGSILFLAERLRNSQSGPVNQIQERQLGLVYSAAFGLSSLASDVIELARGGDRLVEMTPVPFSVSEIMTSVRAIVQPMAEEKGLVLKLTPPASDFRVGYPAALNRVLLNLTTNALKFTTEGSVEVVTTQSGRSRVGFAVQDTGRGIPPQVMNTLFDSFRRRVKPGEYFFSSAGLGLSICRKLVEAMGGTLHVETALEKGTKFSFELELPPASSI